jgi:hypothetical protein
VGLSKDKRDQLDALWLAMRLAQSAPLPVKDDDFLFIPFYDKNRPHPDPDDASLKRCCKWKSVDTVREDSAKIVFGLSSERGPSQRRSGDD